MKPISILVALALVVAGSVWFVTRAPIAQEPAQPPAAVAPSAEEREVSLADPRDVEVRAASASDDVPQSTSVAKSPETPPNEAVANAPQSLESMMVERKVVSDRLNELSLPLIQEKFDSGDTEFIGPELNYNSRGEDNQLVFTIKMVPDRGTYRTVITREERPDLYVLKDRIAELARAIRDIEYKAAEAALATK